MTDRNVVPELALDFIVQSTPLPTCVLLTPGVPTNWQVILEKAGHTVVVTRQIDPTDWPTQCFDWVLICDALLAARDAIACLKRAAQRLSPSGKLVAIIANSRHIAQRVAALTGELDPPDCMTRPSRRQFSKDLLLEAARLAALHVHRLQASRPADSPSSGTQTDPAVIRALLAKQGRDDTLDEQCYVLEMGLTSPPDGQSYVRQGTRSLRVLALTDAVDSGIAKIRLHMPLDAFAERGCRHVRYDAFGLVTEDSLRWADVVVIQRGACGHAQRAAEWCLARGKPYVYEIDDLLTELPPFMSHHVGYIRNKPLMEDLIRGAAAVTVTNEHLRTALTHLNQRIWICPNFHIPRREPIRRPGIEPDAPVHLLIAHTDKILLDFFTPVLLQAHQTWGARIEIVAIGPIGETLANAGIPCRQLPIIPLEDFIPTLSAMPNTVAMIPLDDSKFSSCKSAIKFFDYAQGGITTICSDVSPYKDVVVHGHTGLLAENSVQAWLSCIERLIEQPTERVRLACAAQDEVIVDHDLQHAARAWQQVFDELAPDDVAVQLPPQASKQKSSFKKLKDYLRKKNQQRKVRRRLIKATLAAKAADAAESEH